MTQQNPRELLKQGDPQAIASSINRTLKPKGINAEVTRDNGCLHIFLESGKVPDQMVLVDFIRTGMTKLGLESIHTVKVYGIETGQDSPAWQDEIELMSASPMLYADDTSMPNDSVDLDDVESDSGDYYQEEEFDRDNDDDNDEEDDDEEDETPPPKKQFPKWLIPVGILVPVLALAGLFFTKSPPFSSDSTSEPSPPVVAKPSPKAKSGASKPVSPSPGASNEGKPSPSPSSPSSTASAASPAPNAATKPASPVPATTSPVPKPASPAAKAATPKSDNWREAVNQAQKAAILAQTAQSQSEWNAVAADWQKAAKLMNSVPTTSPNYQKAQQKATEYKSNLEVANRRAAAAP